MKVVESLDNVLFHREKHFIYSFHLNTKERNTCLFFPLLKSCFCLVFVFFLRDLVYVILIMCNTCVYL